MKRSLLPVLALGCAAFLTLPATAEAQRRANRTSEVQGTSGRNARAQRSATRRSGNNRTVARNSQRAAPQGGYAYAGFAPGYAPNGTVVNYTRFYGNPNAGLVTANYTPQQPMPGNTPATGGAVIRLMVPDPNAQVTFDEVKTESLGVQRTYVTPPLTGGRELAYTVRATFTRNGQTVNEERRVTVIPGQVSLVDFMR